MWLSVSGPLVGHTDIRWGPWRSGDSGIAATVHEGTKVKDSAAHALAPACRACDDACKILGDTIGMVHQDRTKRRPNRSRVARLVRKLVRHPFGRSSFCSPIQNLAFKSFMQVASATNSARSCQADRACGSLFF